MAEGDGVAGGDGAGDSAADEGGEGESAVEGGRLHPAKTPPAMSSNAIAAIRRSVAGRTPNAASPCRCSGL